jgi:hypothetical protein
MTLYQVMEARGFVHHGGFKSICPFHGDRSPSAYLNPNSLWCFVCNRMYTLRDFEDLFSVALERVPEKTDSTLLGLTQGKAVFPVNTVLFTYPFEILPLLPLQERIKSGQ